MISISTYSALNPLRRSLSVTSSPIGDVEFPKKPIRNVIFGTSSVLRILIFRAFQLFHIYPYLNELIEIQHWDSTSYGYPSLSPQCEQTLLVCKLFKLASSPLANRAPLVSFIPPRSSKLKRSKISLSRKSPTNLDEMK